MCMGKNASIITNIPSVANERNRGMNTPTPTIISKIPAT